MNDCDKLFMLYYWILKEKRKISETSTLLFNDTKYYNFSFDSNGYYDEIHIYLWD